ncbi:MAG: hypothetical protein AAFV93_10730 [Chloroflexota bacterium]
MTYQPPHAVIFDDEDYDLRGDSTGLLPLFDLLGIKPNSVTFTGNYLAEYVVANNVLKLDSIHIAYDLKEQKIADMLKVNGIAPIKTWMGLGYRNISLLMPVTGQITIARKPLVGDVELIFSLTDYEKVLRLSLDDGKVTKIEDFSERIEVLRRKEDEIEDEKKKRWLKRGINPNAVTHDQYYYSDMQSIWDEIEEIIGKESTTFSQK